MNLAIIGLGLSGVSLLRGLIDNKNFNDDINIDVFEKRDELIVGKAYQNDSLTKLLNFKAIYMSVDPHNKYDFINRLLEKGYKEDEKEGLIPRVYYGKYLKDRFTPYINNKNVHIYNEYVKDIVVINTDKDYIFNYKIITDKVEHEKIYDAVFLCIGNSYYKDNYNLEGDKNYINDPYPLDKNLSNIKKDKKVGILGSSASATDMFRYLMKKTNVAKPIYFFTLKDEYKIVDLDYEGNDNIISINNEWIEKIKEENEGFIPLNSVISKIKEDFSKYNYSRRKVYERYKNSSLEDSRIAIKINDQELAFTEKYFMEISLFAADIINSLWGIEREEYFNNYHEMFTFFSGKTPAKTMKWLIESVDKKEVSIVKNTTKVVENKDHTFTVYADLDTNVDYIINATGFETNLMDATSNSEIIYSLVNRNLVLSGRGGKTILVTRPNCNLINQKYGIMENLYLTGMRISGTDIDNNDARIIQRTSGNIANNFMNNLKIKENK